MRANDGTRTAAEVLIDALVINGVRHAFCVPGESYIAALDAFYDRAIALTVCRHESGAAIMAETCGKMTSQPGICFVTRGPGATNASAGIHIARQDSTPLILFVGQIAREMREREAFQELDYRAVFGSIAKWATEIDNPTRLPELLSRAFYTATSGRRDRAGGKRHEPPAEAALGRQAPGRSPWRKPMVGGCCCRGRAFCPAFRAAGRHHVPARPSLPSRPSLLRRRSRHWPQSQASGAGERRRSHCADWRPARRAALAGLHAPRYSRAAPDACACLSGSRGAWPRLPAASCHQRNAHRLCCRARRPRATRGVAVARGDCDRARRLSRLDRQTDAGARRSQSRRDHCRAA